MDFLSGLAKGGDKPKPTSDQPNNPDHHQPENPSNYDLYGSAKVVADAAQAQFRNEPEKFDKAKVAGASADILGAASEYGKLDETKGVGKYVDQAEDYLRQLKTPGSAANAAAASGEHKPTADQGAGAVPESTGGGAGEYLKKAEGFLNKPSDGEKPASGGGESAEKAESGGYGGAMKMAGDFLKK